MRCNIKKNNLRDFNSSSLTPGCNFPVGLPFPKKYPLV